MNVDKLMKAIQEVKTGRYGCTMGTLNGIREASGGGALATGANCFCYGFLQGQKAAKAEAKKKAIREMEERPPCCDKLMKLIVANMDNERFLEMMVMRAKSLESLIGEEENP